MCNAFKNLQIHALGAYRDNHNYSYLRSGAISIILYQLGMAKKFIIIPQKVASG